MKEHCYGEAQPRLTADGKADSVRKTIDSFEATVIGSAALYFNDQ